MRNEFNIKSVGDISSNVADYSERMSYITQMDNKNEKLKEYWDKFFPKNKYPTYEDYLKWMDINIHYISQMWGSTACGWGGIGGSAMTKSYTMIIINEYYKLAWVYYGNKLAYIFALDEESKMYEDKCFRNLPPIHSTNKLNVLYKSR